MPGSPIGHVRKSIVVTIDTAGTPTDYSCAVTGADFIRGGRAKQTSMTACGIVTDYGPAEDTAHIEFNVDMTALSLWRILIANEGTEAVVSITDDFSQVIESASCRLVPGTPSGKLGEFHTAIVDLGVVGPITVTDPVGP